MRPLHRLQKRTPSALFWQFQHPSTRKCITWMLSQNLCMEIYMNHPKGYITDPYFVCKLKKSLYGLKQAPREWYSKMDSFLLSQNFQRCKSDTNVYLQKYDGNLIIIVLYFDDNFIIGSTLSSITFIKTSLHDAFEMSDLGLLKQFPGIEISQEFDGIMVTWYK